MGTQNNTGTSGGSKPQAGGTGSNAATPAANTPTAPANNANGTGNQYEVVNPTSTAMNLYIKAAGGFVDIPAEGTSKPMTLDKDAHAAVKKSLNKRPAVRIQEVKKDDKG